MGLKSVSSQHAKRCILGATLCNGTKVTENGKGNILLAKERLFRDFPRKNTSEGGGTRTHDQRIKSPLLYRLSYALAAVIAGEVLYQRPQKSERVHSDTANEFQSEEGTKVGL